MFRLANQLQSCIYDGVNDTLFDDLEDSYQVHVANDLGCDILLTIKEKHYKQFTNNTSMKVITPASLVEEY